MSGWQPIETAPKDGRRIILWLANDDNCSCAVGHYHAGRFVMENSITASDDAGEWLHHVVLSIPWTHWMHLPPAPEAT